MFSSHVYAYYIHVAKGYARYGWRPIAKAYVKLAEQELAAH